MDLAKFLFRAKSQTVRRSAGLFYEELLRNERLSELEFDSLVRNRRTSLLRFAAANSAFYARTVSDAGIDPAEAHRDEVWQRLPILERATIKDNLADLPTPYAVPRNIRPALTGGSTGEPLKTMQDARVPSLAFSWRMYGWWGIQPWDNIARIGRWGFGRTATLKNNLAWWPTKQIYLDAGLLDSSSMEVFHDQFDKARPRLLEGYVGAMLEFANFVEATGRATPSLIALATTAAPLTPSARLRLESVFGVPVYDEYRGSEIGWMAGECAEQEGLHVFADARYLEVVDADGDPVAPGEVGDIVITDLTNRVFPLIRYRLGDRGSIVGGVCRCGRALTRIAPPDGRTTDLLRLPSGRVLAHRIMGMFGQNPESVRLFQIHQLADYSITVRVVPGGESDHLARIEEAVESLRQRIAYEVPIRTEIVSSLPYTRGKVKYVISDVAEGPNPQV